MHPEDIKSALRKRGVTQADIARRLGVSKTTINYVITGKMQSRRVAEAIAEAAGRPVKALWPKKYEVAA
jgi:lambda repressor-like predicted transcriptional regulator